MTDTSSVWSQLLFPYPLCPQNWIPFSVPAQFTSSRKIGPVPRPKKDLPLAVAFALGKSKTTIGTNIQYRDEIRVVMDVEMFTTIKHFKWAKKLLFFHL